MSDLQKFFTDALLARRANGLSLSDSVHLALGVAKIPNDGDEFLVRLHSVVSALVSAIELDGKAKASAGNEPTYHNRQHTADAVLSMAWFLSQITLFDAYEKLRLLLVMLVHDYGHCGIAKQKPHLSHEQESIELLQETPLMLLPPPDIELIKECILGTGPDQVAKVSEAYRLSPSDRYCYQRALVNDADIAPSFIDPLGFELSKMILLEKGVQSPSEDAIKDMLSAFRARAIISTPTAREALGI